MKISTKGRYALRLMIDLAMNGTESYVPIKSVSQRQEISEKYLEQIITLDDILPRRNNIVQRRD